MDDAGIVPKSRAPRPPQEPGYKRIVFCTGKVFYELHAERERQGKQDEVAVIRVEQVRGLGGGVIRVEQVRGLGGGVIRVEQVRGLGGGVIRVEQARGLGGGVIRVEQVRV